MDLKALIESLLRTNTFWRLVNNPMAQFGTPRQPLLGASLLPERNVLDNMYVEESIRYRSPVANDGTRYSPVQLKQGMLIGSMEVKLVDSDIGSQMNASDYDAFLRLIKASTGSPDNLDNPGMAAVAALTNWAQQTIMWPMLFLDEKRRWEAIVDAQVTRTGDNGFSETISYSDPAGHRAAEGGVWSNDGYDPYDDIVAMMEFAANKGYRINRIIAGRPVVSKLGLNANIRARVGRLSIVGGTAAGLAGRASLAEINAMLGADDIPPIEVYNAGYQTQSSADYYLKRDVMVMVASTGRTEQINLPDDDPIMIQDTLGYTGIGRAAGQSGSGRVMHVRSIDDSKPPRIEGEAWATSLPVILDPEAIYVIKDIT